MKREIKDILMRESAKSFVVFFTDDFLFIIPKGKLYFYLIHIDKEKDVIFKILEKGKYYTANREDLQDFRRLLNVDKIKKNTVFESALINVGKLIIDENLYMQIDVSENEMISKGILSNLHIRIPLGANFIDLTYKIPDELHSRDFNQLVFLPVNPISLLDGLFPVVIFIKNDFSYSVIAVLSHEAVFGKIDIPQNILN